jgi:hypothetical protein
MSGRTPGERLRRKSEHGFQGYPIGTIAFYGPDNQRATKVAVGIVHGENKEGPDYPLGGICPQCPYWASRQRPI